MLALSVYSVSLSDVTSQSSDFDDALVVYRLLIWCCSQSLLGLSMNQRDGGRCGGNRLHWKYIRSGGIKFSLSLSLVEVMFTGYKTGNSDLVTSLGTVEEILGQVMTFRGGLLYSWSVPLLTGNWWHAVSVLKLACLVIYLLLGGLWRHTDCYARLHIVEYQ